MDSTIRRRDGIEQNIKDVIAENTLTNNIIAMILQDGQPSSSHRGTKSASESKPIPSLMIFKDKSGLKQWHDRFINALSQPYVTSSRLTQRMRRQLDTKVGWETEAVTGFSKDFDYILLAKTDDEVTTRVSDGESNDGIIAYQMLYLSIAGIIGQA